MKPILEIKRISKKFRIAHQHEPYLNLRDKLAGIFKGSMDVEEFWALKDVSFDVMPGDTIGIIGKNGAGKSTLLKILSRITPPTSGKVVCRGRIASLLEVGTGFHSELSGRENIFMNGSILGMKREEIKKNFDAIVDFSGVEKFIDTPLKHFSSGMQLRLAFAVAAFLENEILIVDEVLAVGDAEFQKKCMGKMNEVSQSGRTILFVSHNMGSVIQLCRRCIQLQNGILVNDGSPDTVVNSYFNSNVENYNAHATNKKEIYIKKVETLSSENNQVSEFAHSKDIHLRIHIGVNQFLEGMNVGVAMLRNDKKRVFTVNKDLKEFLCGGQKEVVIDLVIEGKLIAPMNYSFLVALNTRNGSITYDLAESICPIRVYDDGTDLAFAEGIDYGCIILKDKWKKIL